MSFLKKILPRKKTKTDSNANINKSPEVQTNKIFKKELIDRIATMIQNGAQIVEFEKSNGARVFDVEGKDRKFIRIEETPSGLIVTQDDNVLILCDANGNDLDLDFNAIVGQAKKEAEKKEQADGKMYTTIDSQRHTGTPNYNAERGANQQNTIPPYVDNRTVYVTRCPQQQNSQTNNNKTKIITEQINEYGVKILRTYEIDGNTISCSIQPLSDETVKIEHYKIEVCGEVQNGIFICKVSGCFPYYYSKFLQETQHPYETEFYIGLNIEKIKNDPKYMDYVFCEFLKGRIGALDKNINAKVKNKPIRYETFGLYLGSIVEENGAIKTVFDKEFCTFATNDKRYQTFEEKVVALIYEENGISFDSTQPSYDTETTRRYK